MAPPRHAAKPPAPRRPTASPCSSTPARMIGIWWTVESTVKATLDSSWTSCSSAQSMAARPAAMMNALPSNPGASSFAPSIWAPSSKPRERPRQTTPVMGRMRARSCIFDISASAEPRGAWCSTNCARAHRCELTTIDASCRPTPSAEVAPPVLRSRPWHTPPATISSAAIMRRAPSRSRPQNRALAIMKITAVDVIIVRAATLRNWSDLLVRPISAPCSRPRLRSWAPSRQRRAGSGGRWASRASDSSQAMRAVAGCDAAVKPKACGKGPFGPIVSFSVTTTSTALTHQMLVKASTRAANFQRGWAFQPSASSGNLQYSASALPSSLST
mmetsp:Transcript_59779/g.170033  ORF Transcript_59779/g.170033 Transcript_59779/m.170033 type:complete len:330 (+) Transcript_59779:42-1031(+)